MRRTFRILMIAIVCFLSGVIAANAGDEKPINVNDLPAQAQALLSDCFKNQKVMLATMESGIVSKNYDVVLQDGTKLEFDKKGNLTEVDCKHGIVPSQLVPQPIKHFLKNYYEGQSVRKIEIKKKGYEFELVNGLDLTFDKHFKLTDVD